METCRVMRQNQNGNVATFLITEVIMLMFECHYIKLPKCLSYGNFGINCFLLKKMIQLRPYGGFLAGIFLRAKKIYS